MAPFFTATDISCLVLSCWRDNGKQYIGSISASLIALGFITYSAAWGYGISQKRSQRIRFPEMLRLQADVRIYAMKEFGELISEARKSLAMSQRELAAKIKKEDGESISTTYLNDIEHGRRNPPSSEHLLEQFAKVLGLPKDLLMMQAGYLPSDIMDPIKKLSRTDPDKAETVLRAFRKHLDNLKR